MQKLEVEVELTPNTEEPKASRSFGNNVYLHGDVERFQVKYDWKKKPFMNFNDWSKHFGGRPSVTHYRRIL